MPPELAERKRERVRVLNDRGWTDPHVLWEEDGLRVVRLVEPEDIDLWATIMGHCGASHLKWIRDEQIWHFLTILDGQDVPHTTMHAKDVEWFGVPHPADSQPGYTEGILPYQLPKVDAEGRAVEWVPSRRYEPRFGGPEFPDPIMIEGHRAYLMYAQGTGGTTGRYAGTIQRFYEAMKEQQIA